MLKLRGMSDDAAPHAGWLSLKVPDSHAGFKLGLSLHDVSMWECWQKLECVQVRKMGATAGHESSVEQT